MTFTPELFRGAREGSDRAVCSSEDGMLSDGSREDSGVDSSDGEAGNEWDFTSKE